ncbi:MAG: hypothetical protein H7282_05020 [Cytophagaceae bacterium]|nr:hypothetical protein [Cytophagaceae bacterium]
MSWLDKIQTDFIITTGDGAKFYPLWMNATKNKEYNLAEFEFPDTPGTLVDRAQPKGKRYILELFFQGADHLDISDSFDRSADDKRAWVISHPLYGSLTVQPASINFDNTQFNSTKITVAVIETIVTGGPKFTQDPVDKISFDKNNLDDTTVDAFDVVPNAKDINTLTANNKASYSAGAKKVPTINAEAYFNSFNAANTAIANATAQPLAAIRASQAVINAPSQFQSSVKDRFSLIGSQFSNLLLSVKGSTTRASKKIFESNGTTLVSSMALASANPIQGDYTDANSVYDIIDSLLNTHNTFIEKLDSLQSLNGGDPDSYIPDADAISGMTNLVNFSVSNLFTIAMGAKQERSFYLDADSNIINVTHKVLRLVPDDSTLDTFININNIGINEMLVLKKGRKIIYYV